MIDPRAIVDPGARIAANVEIGPFSIIGPDVEIGEGTVIGPHVIVRGPTTIGKNNHIFPVLAKNARTKNTPVSQPRW